MTISDLIREYLVKHPEGAVTRDILIYCENRNGPFKGEDHLKCVSGILVKMRDKRCEVTSEGPRNRYTWKLVQKRL
jgi:hypothetical protein